METNNNEELCDLRELNEHVIGIDLGTTNTCVAIYRNESLEIIPDEYGNRTIPSYVAFTNVNRYIGLEAKKQKDLNPKNVCYEFKRYIGRKIDDPLVVKEKNLFSYDLSCDENNNIVFVPEINSKMTLTPEELSAAILTKARIMASEYLGEKVTKCVITIPAHFNDGQRQATKDAAQIAGLECIRIINEPTAAALANGLLRRSKAAEGETKNILVYDFGGGTLDVSIIEIEDGRFFVKASSGNTRMGGSDFDNRLMSYCMGKFQKKYGIKELIEVNSLGLQKLRLQCEQAKKVLSISLNTQIAVRNFYDGKDLYVPITRAEFEKICQELFLICLKPIDDALYICDKMDIEDIDEIILVGGMTRMPKIRELIKCRFGKDANYAMNPDEAVAAGAAIQGFMLSHYDDPFSTSITLMETVALSIGVETAGGVMDVIIERGDIIPTKSVKSYSTIEDYVDTITVKVYEGERKLIKDNFLIGSFDLGGIEKELRGIPEIDVKITIDENGLINVTAINVKTADEESLPVTSNKGRLTKLQIENLIAEAQELEIRDQLNKRKKMMHYQLNDFCNNILTNLTNGNFKLSERDKITIKDDINKVIQWLSDCKFFERSDKEYTEITESVKKRYGVLLLTGHIDDGKVREFSEDNKEMTTIYGDDKDEDEEMKRVFEQVENEENGFDGLSDDMITELKELRNAVFDICYSICEILYSGNLTISNEHVNELKDYINDSLMWLHIHEKPTKIEYKIKIDEINETCNKVFDHYKNEGQEVFKQNEFLSANKTCRDELENMCVVIKLMISDGAFPIDKKFLDMFQQKIDETLDWMCKCEQNINLESESEEKNKYYLDCKDKLDDLNMYCGDLNQKLHGINIDEKVDVLGRNRIILTGMASNFESDVSDDTGIDLITLRQQEQTQILENMINEEDVEDVIIDESAFEIKYDVEEPKNKIEKEINSKIKNKKNKKRISKKEKRKRKSISKKRRMRNYKY